MAKMFKPSTSHDSMSSLDAALLAQYREAFDSFDSNRDGRISIRELSAVMENLGESPSKKELKEMIKSVDGDGSGKIDFDEFIRMMEARTAQRMNGGNFRVMDKNKDGIITLDELRIAMDNLGEDITESELRKMLRLADSNRDGCIDFAEFKKLMQSLGM
uniref:Calmodulin n=1 Tax=Macrostomum lignano TaxID=282301 RepID=A0A1I8GT51_9PLAT